MVETMIKTSILDPLPLLVILSKYGNSLLHLFAIVAVLLRNTQRNDENAPRLLGLLAQSAQH